jgi:hypothetical protein
MSQVNDGVGAGKDIQAHGRPSICQVNDGLGAGNDIQVGSLITREQCQEQSSAGGRAWATLLSSRLHAHTTARRGSPWMAADVRSRVGASTVGASTVGASTVGACTEGASTGAQEGTHRTPQQCQEHNGGSSFGSGVISLDGTYAHANGAPSSVHSNVANAAPAAELSGYEVGSKGAEGAKRAHGMHVLRALHALYEDCKLDAFRCVCVYMCVHVCVKGGGAKGGYECVQSSADNDVPSFRCPPVCVSMIKPCLFVH